jgi:hypothetical protein
MFPEVDPLGPEMRSTGEVQGLADTFGMAFYKAEELPASHPGGDGQITVAARTDLESWWRFAGVSELALELWPPADPSVPERDGIRRR